MLARKKISSRKTAVLAGSIGLIWLVIGSLVYYNFSGKKVAPPPINNPVALNPPVAKTPAGVSAGAGPSVDLFNNPVFQQLKIYGEVPLQVKTLGRANPFEPPPNFNLTGNK